MSYNSGVVTSVYNTRRSAYLTSCNDQSRALEGTITERARNHSEYLPNSEDYMVTSCHSDTSPVHNLTYSNEGRSVSPFDTGNYDQSEMKTGRKRANTTSSGSGETKRTANKICRVCGDKAFSYNFNVITCESCKAFFRRNANKEKEIRCPFNERCEINIVSRRFCQRCRLAKCFNVGMKKEWIMSDEARLEKKQRVEENRERRLQDALTRVLEDDMNDDDLSLDDQPSGVNMSIRDYTSEDSNSKPTLLSQVQFSMTPEESKTAQIPQYQPIVAVSAPQTASIPHQSTGFSNHDYDFASMAPQTTTGQLCLSHHIVDSIPTTGAATTADVSSTTTSMPSMDIDPTTTMTSNGFMPPSLHNLSTELATAVGQQQHQSFRSFAGGLMSVTQSDVESSFIAAQAAQAQAQLAAQVHAQAAINHQHQQFAAAVVAQQVVAQMTAPTVAAAAVQPLAAPLAPIQAITAPLTAPIAPLVPIAPINELITPITAPITSAIIPKVPTPNAVFMSQLGQANPEMVTIPKDMLLKLIQSNTLRSMNCSCTCMCGRYPPGSNIVEEVTKDLLANTAGSSTSSSAEPQREETKLDTAEDMQRNGLLPSDDSSVQWLNTGAPNIDPCGFLEDSSSTRRDSIFCSAIVTDNETEPREFTSQEKEKLEEINEVANRWINDGLDSFTLLQLFGEQGVRCIVAGLKMLSTFNSLSRIAQRCVVITNIYSYCLVKWLQHHESISLEGIEVNVMKKILSLLEMDAGEYRVQPGTFNTLAAMILLDVQDGTQLANMVHGERDEYSRLLQKVISSNSQGTQESPQLLDIIPDVHSSAYMLASLIGPINEAFVDSLL